ncbi:MAG TPA: hypothetical protein VD735_03735 [Candidatus Saccharimonadales bacterium]|nr:hypothetical protein [Candidatus Saccharimonadales bacterium]
MTGTRRIVGGMTAATMAFSLGGGTSPSEQPMPKRCYEITDDQVNVVGQTQASRIASGVGERMLRTLNIACAESTSGRNVTVSETPADVTFSISRLATHAKFNDTTENMPLWHGASVTVNRNPDGSLNDGGITDFRVYLSHSEMPERDEDDPIVFGGGGDSSFEVSGERDPGQNYCNWDITTVKQFSGRSGVGNTHTQIDRSPEEAAQIASYITYLGEAADTIVHGALNK